MSNAGIFFQGKAYLRHFARSGNQHAIHSPFLFDLYNKVFSNSVFAPKKMHKAFAAVERERSRLLADQTRIPITDFGAGSRISQQKTRSVASLAKSGLMSVHWVQALYRMGDFLKIDSVLELGTSLGITTAYLASIPSVQKVITMDGCAGSLGVARQVWANIGLHNIEAVEGRIEEMLPEVLKEFRPQLIILDANHRYEAVMAQFNALKPHLREDSIVVVDDLYWSPSMARAWNEIRNDDAVRQSLDFFWQGWLFFRPGQARERFVLSGK